MWNPFKPNGRGSAPVGYTNIEYTPGYRPQQDKWVYPWPNVPAHETRAALTNAWNGNQLPGPTNFIPGVVKSRFMWNMPTSYANTLKNQQYNAGYNIMGSGAIQNSKMQAIAYQIWMNRGSA